MLRIERPKAPDQQASQPVYRREVLEAACCLSVGLDETKLLKAYGERTLNAADPLRHIGLRELVAECARMGATTFRVCSAMVLQRFEPVFDDVASRHPRERHEQDALGCL